ncbi:MAG: PilZ domain-containing protein [Hyphomicrobiaceae bacterium]
MSDANRGRHIKAPSRAATVSERRQDLRLATQHLVKLHYEPTIFGELVNLSRTGAELEINGDRSPEIGEQTTIELLDGTTVPGLVMWRRGRSIGLQFDLKFADASDLLHLDHLGRDLFLSIVRQQKLRASQGD